MTSLKLDSNWDLQLNSIGNIATVDNKYDISQTVANATRLFQGDYIFDEDLGIPYIPDILSNNTNSVFLEPYVRQQALRIQGVQDISIANLEVKDRELKGDIQITTTDE